MKLSFLSILLIVIGLNSHSAIAQTTRSSYESPSNIEITPTTSGGSSRGECENINIDILPILDNQFSFKINKVPSTPLKFSITQPKVVKSLYKTELIVNKIGIIKIDLPEKITLQKEKNYVWTFAFYCGSFPEWYFRGLLRLTSNE